MALKANKAPLNEQPELKSWKKSALSPIHMGQGNYLSLPLHASASVVRLFKSKPQSTQYLLLGSVTMTQYSVQAFQFTTTLPQVGCYKIMFFNEGRREKDIPGNDFMLLSQPSKEAIFPTLCKEGQV